MIGDEESSEFDIHESEKKIKKIEQTLNNWKEKLAKAEEKENKLNELPEVLKEMKDYLVEEWVKYDLERKAKKVECPDDYKDYKALREYNTWLEDYFLYSEEDFRKREERTAEACIIDLQNRVYKKVGKITDWDNVYFSGKALNGWIKGENGTTEVETILAGGYNIQIPALQSNFTLRLDIGWELC